MNRNQLLVGPKVSLGTPKSDAAVAAWAVLMKDILKAGGRADGVGFEGLRLKFIIML